MAGCPVACRRWPHVVQALRPESMQRRSGRRGADRLESEGWAALTSFRKILTPSASSRSADPPVGADRLRYRLVPLSTAARGLAARGALKGARVDSRHRHARLAAMMRIQLIAASRAGRGVDACIARRAVLVGFEGYVPSLGARLVRGSSRFGPLSWQAIPFPNGLTSLAMARYRSRTTCRYPPYGVREVAMSGPHSNDQVSRTLLRDEVVASAWRHCPT